MLKCLILNSSLPAEPKGIYDGTEKQTHIIAGFSYLPIPNVVIKADVRVLHTGAQNPALVINPPPNALPYKQTNQFFKCWNWLFILVRTEIWVDGKDFRP